MPPDGLTLPEPPTAPATTSVLIVDDNPIVRRGLRSFLEISDQVEVVGEAGDGVLAEAMTRSLRPDVVLLDVRMPRRDGIATSAVISELTTVVMMTFTDEPEHIRGALAAGAAGYLVHGTFDAGTLVQTVLGAAQGTGAFSPQALQVIREAGRAPTPADRPDPRRVYGLSERQAELMDLIARGLSNHAIAGELFLAEKTVKNHINAIFGKLGVTTRAEAIALWLGAG